MTFPRVLQVIARMNVGGTARYLDVLTSGLNSRGVETLLATGNVQGHEAEDPALATLPHVRLEHLGRRIDLRQDLRARHELAEIIKQFKPDVIHTHTFKAGALGRLLASDTPHVHTFHGFSPADPEFQGAKGRVMVAIERGLVRRSDALVAISQHTVNELVAARIAERDRFTVISSGVRTLTLPPPEAARDEFGISRDSVVVGWLGRLIAVKAPERVIALASEFPDVTFLLAGDGPLRDQLCAQAPGNVVMPGWVNAADVLAASDVMVMTSVSEGMPVALIESQLAGKPVVATRVGGIPEAVLDGVTGYLVNPDQLGTAVGSLLRDPATRERMGSAARERAGHTFSPEAMVNAHVQLYERMRTR